LEFRRLLFRSCHGLSPPVSLCENEIVPMDDLFTVIISQTGAKFLRRGPEHRRQLVRGEVRHPAGDDLTVEVADLDRVTGLEVTVGAGYARRQQGRSP